MLQNYFSDKNLICFIKMSLVKVSKDYPIKNKYCMNKQMC